MAFWKKEEENSVNNSSNQTSGQKKSTHMSSSKHSKTPTSSDTLVKYGNVRSALGKGTVIQGKLSFDTPVRIDGKLGGEVFSTETLIVGPTGEIDAKVEVATLVVMGTVKGEIEAKDKVEILASGKIYGDVNAQALVIEEGALFQGKCSMGTLDKVVSAKPKATKAAVSSKADTKKKTSNDEEAEASLEAAVH